MATFNAHPCEQEASPCDQKGKGNEAEHDVVDNVWNRNATLLLLDFYRDYQEAVSKGRMKKKHFGTKFR